MNSQLNTPWKKVVEVNPRDDFSLELIWEDANRSEIKLDRLIHEKDLLWRLRYPRYFKQVTTDVLGGVAWPEGEDLSPAFLAHHGSPS